MSVECMRPREGCDGWGDSHLPKANVIPGVLSISNIHKEWLPTSNENVTLYSEKNWRPKRFEKFSSSCFLSILKAIHFSLT